MKESRGRSQGRAKERPTKRVPPLKGKSAQAKNEPLDIMAMIALYSSPNLTLSSKDMADFVVAKFRQVHLHRLSMRMHFACKKIEFLEETGGSTHYKHWSVPSGKLRKIRNLVDKYVDGNRRQARTYGIEKSSTFSREKNRSAIRRQKKAIAAALTASTPPVVQKGRGRSASKSPNSRSPSPSVQKQRGGSVRKSPNSSIKAKNNSGTVNKRAAGLRPSTTPTRRYSPDPARQDSKKTPSARVAAPQPRNGKEKNTSKRRKKSPPAVVSSRRDLSPDSDDDLTLAEFAAKHHVVHDQSPDDEISLADVASARDSAANDPDETDNSVADLLSRRNGSPAPTDHQDVALLEDSDSEEEEENVAQPEAKRRRVSESSAEEDLFDENEAEEVAVVEEPVEEREQGVSEEVDGVVVYGTPTGEKYTQIKELGSGAFGQVYLVTDVQNLQFALKITKHADLDEESTAGEDAFYVKVLAAPVKNAFLAAKYPMFLTRLNDVVFRCERMDLFPRDLYDSLYQDQVKFDCSQILETIYQMSSALEYLNRLGFIHSDIKPDNIMLAAYDLFRSGETTCIRSIQARLIDFNVIIEKEHDGPFHFTGQTYPYMSPEMALEMACDARIDTWGLAMVAVQMLETGFYVLNDDDVQEVLEDDEARNAIILGEIERIFGPLPGHMKEKSKFASFRDKPFFPSLIPAATRSEVLMDDVYRKHLAGVDRDTVMLKDTFNQMLSLDVNDRPLPKDLYDYLTPLLPGVVLP